MTKTREIEFKTMLTAAEFARVKAHYRLADDRFKSQTNCYFDTPDQQLRSRHWGLRIRLYPDRGELTLKVPAKDAGRWEITDPLTRQEAQQLRDQGRILSTGVVAEHLRNHQIQPEALELIADLTTLRAEFPIKEGLLALDESFYGKGKMHDYELELEVTAADTGAAGFDSLLAQLGLPYRPAENKITRAIKEI